MKRRSRASEMATAKTWAHHLMQRDDWVVMDIETTGLGINAEVVEVAIVGNRGEVLLNTLVRPRTPPEPGASRVHGLRADALRGQPRFEQIHGSVAKVLTGRTVIAYNAQFDQSVLSHMCQTAGLRRIDDCTWECAMLRYEQWRGFRASLATACEIESIDGASRHRALPDARLVWNLIRRMAGESG